MDTSTLTIW